MGVFAKNARAQECTDNGMVVTVGSITHCDGSYTVHMQTRSLTLLACSYLIYEMEVDFGSQVEGQLRTVKALEAMRNKSTIARKAQTGTQSIPTSGP